MGYFGRVAIFLLIQLIPPRVSGVGTAGREDTIYIVAEELRPRGPFCRVGCGPEWQPESSGN